MAPKPNKTTVSELLPSPPEVLPTLAKGQKPPPGFVGYSHEGHFIHTCACGKDAPFGVGYFPNKGEFGKWHCREHRPKPLERVVDEDGERPSILRAVDDGVISYLDFRPPTKERK